MSSTGSTEPDLGPDTRPDENASGAGQDVADLEGADGLLDDAMSRADD